jgi:hypothetical protein
MLRIPHCLDNRLTDSGKAVSSTRRPHSIPQKHYFSASGTHFCYRLSEPQGLVRPEGLGKLKIFTLACLEPATFRLVAQCLNQYTTACPGESANSPLHKAVEQQTRSLSLAQPNATSSASALGLLLSPCCSLGEEMSRHSPPRLSLSERT